MAETNHFYPATCPKCQTDLTGPSSLNIGINVISRSVEMSSCVDESGRLLEPRSDSDWIAQGHLAYIHCAGCGENMADHEVSTMKAGVQPPLTATKTTAIDACLARWKESVAGNMTTLGFEEWVRYMKKNAEEPEPCDGCDDVTPGIRPDSSPHAGAPPPGFTVVERCDTCRRYANDLEAARAYGSDAQWQTGNNTAQAICRPPLVSAGLRGP